MAFENKTSTSGENEIPIDNTMNSEPLDLFFKINKISKLAIGKLQ